MAEKQISILLVAKNLASGAIGKVTKDVSTLGKVSNRAGQGMRSLAGNLAKLGAVAAVGLGVAIKSGIEALAESEAAMAQTEAVIKSTGGAAKVTAGQIDDLAGSLQNATSIEDDAIQSGANMLLTFTNIRNGAGANNDVFNQSLAVLADMSTALGGDMSKSAIQLGKALNDPITGVTALKKVGVAFTADQMKWIKSTGTLNKAETKRYADLKKHNKAEAERYKAGVLDTKRIAAQKLILKELNTEFGGSGAAQADTYAGKMRLIGFAVEDAQKALATGFLPVILKAGEWLRTKLADPQVLADIQSFGNSLAGVFDEALTFATSIPWDSVKDAAVGIGTAAKGALDLFKQMPDWVKTILIGGAIGNKLTGGALGDIVGELGKGLIKGVLGINAGVVNINAGVVNGGGGLPGGKGGGVGDVAGTVAKGGIIATAGAAGLVTAGALAGMAALFYGLPAIAALQPGFVPEKGINETSARDPGFQANRQIAALLAGVPKIADNTAQTVSINRENSRGLNAVRAAALESARAIRAKKWDVDVKVNVPVRITTKVSVRDVTRVIVTSGRYNGKTVPV